MFSPIVNFPFTQTSGSGQNALYSAANRLVCSTNFLFVSGVHQLRILPVSSNSPSLIVEAVSHLVSNHGADCTIVHRSIGVRIEKGRLQNRSRKGDLVHQRVVVRIDRLGSHTPFQTARPVCSTAPPGVPSQTSARSGRSQKACRPRYSGPSNPAIVTDNRCEARTLPASSGLQAAVSHHPSTPAS